MNEIAKGYCVVSQGIVPIYIYVEMGSTAQ